MNRSQSFVVFCFCFVLAQAALAAPPSYGLDRRELNEPYLNKRMPGTIAGPFPQKLSETGAFENTATLTPMIALIPYKVNTALWSDGTDKTRWMFIPKTGKIGFTLSNWSFPPGTVFVKHFDLVVNTQGNTTTSRRLETRFLVVEANTNVYGVTYKWLPDGSDAMLLTNELDEEIAITNGINVTTNTWHYPSPDQCLQCHTKESGGAENIGVLGVKTAQQNGNFTYPNGVTDNQLRTLNHIGLFSPALNEGDIPTMPKMAALTDNSATLETRVRSYLDANCAHCHSPGGVATSMGAEYNAQYQVPFPQQHIVNTIKNYIKFRDPDKSEILQYDSNRGGGTQMPPLGTSIVDSTWTNLLMTYIMTAFNPTNAQGSALGDKVTIVFNNVPDNTSGAATANYVLSGNGQTNTLSGGTVDAGTKSVTFNVTPVLTAGEAYKIVINNVLDTSTPQNRVWPNSTLNFVAQGGLIGPANDSFTNSSSMTGSDATDTGANCTATTEPGEPVHGNKASGHSVWWSWTAPADGPVTLDTIGSSFDTILAVYTGNSVSGLTLVTNNDDYTTAEASRVIFTAVNGTTYHFAVDGYNGDCGDVQINLHQGPLPQAPGNDLFDNAYELTDSSGSASGSNVNATKETGEPDHAHNSGGASVWWYWTAPDDGVVTFDTAGSSFDTTLAVYVGSSVDALSLIAENDDDGGLPTSKVQFTATAGVTYQVAVDGYYGRSGNITLNYEQVPAPVSLNLHVTPDSGSSTLSLDGPSGTEVEVQATSDLIHWQSIFTNILVGGSIQVPESISTSVPQRFYRVVPHTNAPTQ